MKFSHFFGFYLLAAVALFELTSKKVFHTSSIRLLSEWIEKREAIAPVIFLAGIGGVVALIFLAARTHETYLSIVAKPESYIFLGDRLKEGFYAYAEGNPVKKEIFIPSFLDANMYPASAFDALYKKVIVLRSPANELIKFQFYHTGNLILWSIMHLSMIMFAVLGFLTLFKTYADLASIKATFGVMNERTGNMLTIVIMVIVALYAISVVVMKWSTRNIIQSSESVEDLPDNIQPGAIVEGKVVAAETFTAGSSGKRASSRFYRRYTIAFDQRNGFLNPVYLNWSEKKIFPDTMVSASRSLKAELKLRAAYYGLAFERLDQSKETGDYFPFQVNKDMSIIPYLAEKKEMIPALLKIKPT